MRERTQAILLVFHNDALFVILFPSNAIKDTTFVKTILLPSAVCLWFRKHVR